jgi:hypothetical protein
MKICSVPGCIEEHDAKGYCRSHYKKWKLHGDPLITKQRPRGSGWKDKKGYQVHTIDGKAVKLSRYIAGQALGRPLPLGSVVHHVDENKDNNFNNNLVICESYGYHRILHMRIDALKATGDVNMRKCPYCHEYDHQRNMRDEKVRFVHTDCRRKFDLKRQKGGSDVIHV